jgi:glutamate 5-kinase
VGVRAIEGSFSRGDAVDIRSLAGKPLGRGLVAYDSAEAARIIGHPSARIGDLLTHPGRSWMVHRDDLALFAE